jgi:replication fork protection complex subunit Csm3/Swi3
MQYSDASRLLAFYQLWLDDIFPKARFLDALAMVEKMGHKKRMQLMRMEWINEGKPRSSVHEDSLFDEPALPTQENGEREKTATRIAPIFEKSGTERLKTPEANGDVDMLDDLYDATPRAARRLPLAADSHGSVFGGGETSIFGATKETDDIPPDDDLDALLAEEEMMQAETAAKKLAPVKKVIAPEDDFDDDLDALMAEQEMTQPEHIQNTPARAQSDDFEDDLDALLAEEENLLTEEKTKTKQVSKAPVDRLDELDDDMEALMEMEMA